MRRFNVFPRVVNIQINQSDFFVIWGFKIKFVSKIDK